MLAYITYQPCTQGSLAHGSTILSSLPHPGLVDDQHSDPFHNGETRPAQESVILMVVSSALKF